MSFFLIGPTNITAHHLIEKLLSKQEDVSAILSTQDGSEVCHPRFSGLNIELSDTAALTQAMRGHEVVVNLVCHDQILIERSGMSLLQSCDYALKAARQAGVRRFIHVSSISVYGSPLKTQTYTESSPKYASLAAYPSLLQAAESVVLRADCGETEIVILQPGLIYGPGVGDWTDGLLIPMRESLFPLLDGGEGLCNLIHVDDLVHVIVTAAVTPGIHQESFIITNDDPIRWVDFLRCYEEMVNRSSLINIQAEFMRRINRWADYGLLREYRILNKILKGCIFLLQFPNLNRSLIYFDNDKIDFFTAQPHFSNHKAKEALGFSPHVDFETGMQSVKDWFEHSRPVGAES